MSTIVSTYISRESQTTRNVLWSRASVCVSVSAAACPHYCMDPYVTWGSGRGCPLVVHYWADLQSVHGLRCCGNIMRTRTVSEYMLALALCLVYICGAILSKLICKIGAVNCNSNVLIALLKGSKRRFCYEYASLLLYAWLNYYCSYMHSFVY